MDFIRFALRAVVRTRRLSLAVVLTLAMGIALVTVIFNLINGYLWRRLPWPNADRVVAVGYGRAGDGRLPSLPAIVPLLQENVQTFAAVGGYTERWANITIGDQTTNYPMAEVTLALFEVLGVQPRLGRAFRDGDERAGSENVVVLREELWRSQFQGDASAIGRSVRVNGEPAIIIGVMPGNVILNREQLYVPLREAEEPTRVLALLQERGTVAAARAELAAIGSRLLNSPQANPLFNLRDDPMGRAPAGAVGAIFALFLVATLLVVLIASSNVTNLLLVSGEARHDERAIQRALGASRARLFLESMTTSLLLGIAAGALGLVLALWATDIFVAVVPNNMPGWIQFGLDYRVFLFATGTGVMAAILVGAVPARQALNSDVSVLLKNSGLSARRGYARGRRGVIIAEIAISVALVAGTLVAWRRAAQLGDVDPGYDAAQVLSVRVALAANQYARTEQIAGFYREALDRISALPGVDAATVTGDLHRFADNARLDSVGVAWRLQVRNATSSASHSSEVRPQIVDDAFLETLGLPLVRGRFFSSQDVAGGVWTAVVSESLAKELWPNGDALGQEIRVDTTIQRWAVVVGVVADRVQIDSSPLSMQSRARPTVYFNARHASIRNAQFLVRSAADPLALVPGVRDAIRAVDAEQPITSAETLLEEEVGSARLAMKVFAGSMGVIGMAGFLLAVIGLYGLISHITLQRTREIGVRMAMGAAPASIARDVLMDAAKLAGSGLGIGLLLTILLTRLAKGIVFGFVVAGFDPLAYGAAALVFGVIAVAAAWFPARRALAVDPMTAMRSL